MMLVCRTITTNPVRRWDTGDGTTGSQTHQKAGCCVVLLQTLLRGRRGAVRLGQRHDAVRAPQVRLQGLLIGGLQGLEQVLCLPAVVTMESPVAPGEGEGKPNEMNGENTFNVNLQLDLLSSDGSGLRVGVMYAFPDGLSQNSHVSGIVREHGDG